MLVLARKLNEVVVLQHKVTGETITVTVTKLFGQVRLGFNASPDWIIVRKELCDADSSPM